MVVFDEIHQLNDPARVLKIGADAFPNLRILATGSSTLAAGRKFSDTLVGRKRQVHLPPVLWDELPAFGVTLQQRLLHGGGQNEIVRQPKIYGFDTGFVSFVRDWEPLRPDDCGNLWEHLVLEHLQARFPDTPPRYWRDKAGHEVDFVVTHRRDQVDASELLDFLNARGKFVVAGGAMSLDAEKICQH